MVAGVRYIVLGVLYRMLYTPVFPLYSLRIVLCPYILTCNPYEAKYGSLITFDMVSEQPLSVT
jgi:hypothetical protein